MRKTTKMIGFMFPIIALFFLIWTVQHFTDPNRAAKQAAAAQAQIERGRAFTRMVETLAVFLPWFLLLIIVIIAMIFIMVYRTREDRHRRQRDGSRPRIRVYEWPLPKRMLGVLVGRQSPWLEFDPDLATTTTLHFDGQTLSETGTPLDPDHRNAVIGLRRVQALATGDDALTRMKNFFGGRGGLGGLRATEARYLAGAYDPKPRIIDPPMIEGEAEPLPPMPLAEALDMSTSGRFALGYNEQAGDVCYYSPFEHQSLAVAGGPGVGKTMGTGYLMILHALRAGWHVVILDPKGGVDFRWLDGKAEWHPTGPAVLGDQLAAITAEMNRRFELLLQVEASTLAEAPHIGKRMLVVVEEFGVAMNRAQQAGRSQYRKIVLALEELNRLSRATGIHFAFLDQDAKRWSSDVMSAAGRQIVYRTSVQSAAKIGEYSASNLDGIGKFFSGGVLYHGWNMQPVMRQYVAELPLLDALPVIDGVPVRSPGGEGGNDPVRTPTSERTNATSAAVLPEVEGRSQPLVRDDSYWRAFVRDYMENERGAGLWESPARGVNDLARAMSVDATGNADNFTRYKSMASEIPARIREEDQS